jgi:hypothetical protein
LPNFTVIGADQIGIIDCDSKQFSIGADLIIRRGAAGCPEAPGGLQFPKRALVTAAV